MKQKWFVFVCLIIAVKAAVIQQRSADIPVHVVYDKPQINTASVRNLHEQQAEEQKEVIGLKNLAEKPQLSSGELDQASYSTRIVTPNEPIALEVYKPVEQPAPLQENYVDFYNKIEEIILNGANQLQADFDTIHDDKAQPNKQEVLTKVNQTLEDFLSSTKKLIELKASNSLKQDAAASTPAPDGGNFFQSFFSNFQTAANNLFGNLQSTTAAPPGTVLGDAPATTPAPGPVQFAQNAFSQLQTNFNNLFQGGGSTPATGQADETSTQSNNPLVALQTGAQQFFNNVFNRPQNQGQGQADETTTQGNPIGNLFQNAFQNFINIVQPSTVAPGTQSDTATTQGGPLGFFQSVFNQQSTTANPISGVISQVQQVANQQGNNPVAAISSQVSQGQAGLNPFDSNSTATNPISQIQSQVQQATSQQGSNPISAISSQVSQAAGQNGTSNPLTQIQSQVQQATNQTGSNPVSVISSSIQQGSQSFNPFDSNSTGANPINQIQSQVQQATSQQGNNPISVIASQVSQNATGGNAPLNQIQSQVQQVANQQGNNPVASITSQVTQVAGQGANASNPFTQIANQFSQGNNTQQPWTGISSQVTQVSNQAGNNPFNTISSQVSQISTGQAAGNSSLQSITNQVSQVSQQTANATTQSDTQQPTNPIVMVIQSFNPFRRRTTVAPVAAPLPTGVPAQPAKEATRNEEEAINEVIEEEVKNEVAA